MKTIEHLTLFACLFVIAGVVKTSHATTAAYAETSVDTPYTGNNNERSTYITNNYYYDNYYDDYYDYSYSARIRRFYYPSYSGYWDDYYTNYYWYTYDPYFYGVSIYIGYNWWYPHPWRWYWGWTWNWWWGWSWHWCSGPYWSWTWPGYYAALYYGYGWGPYAWGYNHGYWDGYWDGYYDGLAAHYYNSYDNNSYYYGHRPRMGSTGKTVIHGNNSNLSAFGQKYETAVKNETKANIPPVPQNNMVSKPSQTTPVNNSVYTKPTPVPDGVKNHGNYSAPVYSRPTPTSVSSPANPSPQTTPTPNIPSQSRPATPEHTNPEYARPQPSIPQKPDNYVPAPQTTPDKPSYNQIPSSSPKPYTAPHNYSKPNYNSSQKNYEYSNPSINIEQGKEIYSTPSRKENYTPSGGSFKPSLPKGNGGFARPSTPTPGSGGKIGRP